MDFEFLYIEKNIKYLSEKKEQNSALYLAVREKEKRILTDEEVIKLPNLSCKEWPIRKKSSERFLNYLTSKNDSLNILDIGCGNGWFSNQMALVSSKNLIIGLDINSYELEQATRVFKEKNLEFVYGDIFEIQDSFQEKFDIITLNGVIQYFPDFSALLTTLLSLLKSKGEVHIIDSPFYKKVEILKAKKRTKDYYSSLGFPEMANSYFHHHYKNIDVFKTLYKPKKSIINKILNIKDSPFLWVAFFKKN